MADEKKLWDDLNNALKKVISTKKYNSFKQIYDDCSNIIGIMREIISDHGESLDKKRKGVGVRGMKDILSGANLLGKGVGVNSENFEKFCKCLKDISKLSRGGFLWIGSSALSRTTKALCLKAGQKFLDDASLVQKNREEEEKTLRDVVVAQVSDMLLHERYVEKKKFRDLEDRAKLEEQKKKKEYEKKKLDEQKKKELIGKLVKCYKDQRGHLSDGTWGSWPLVTDMSTIRKWSSGSGYYVGEFSVKYYGEKYGIFVYNQKCKDYSTGEDFDGPEVINKLNDWSNDGANTIVVDRSEGE